MEGLNWFDGAPTSPLVQMWINKQTQKINNINDPQKKSHLGTVSKNILLDGLNPFNGAPTSLLVQVWIKTHRCLVCTIDPNLSMHHLLEHINQDIKGEKGKIRTQKQIKLNTVAKEIQQPNFSDQFKKTIKRYKEDGYHATDRIKSKYYQQIPQSYTADHIRHCEEEPP